MKLFFYHSVAFNLVCSLCMILVEIAPMSVLADSKTLLEGVPTLTFPHKPVREISIIISDEGYYPDKIAVYVGERLQLYVTSIGKTPSCLMLPSQNLFLSAQRGKISEGSLVFESSGKFKFYCPAGKIVGQITVIGKKQPYTKKEQPLLSLERASEDQWIPRDF